ncbi:MAG TPA: hypothetical protein VMU53_08115 [Candidatus Sulfotelmatobacter sp.]|nr:hypothetical protein [Candidatus Sulfotelmatobacter sp.]
MSDHERFEELAALSPGALLSDREQMELREHTKRCRDCLRAAEEFRELVCSGLPLTEGAIHKYLQQTRTKSDDGIRERFLLRARREGVVFSPQVQEPSPRRTWRLGTAVAGMAALAAMVLLLLYGPGLYSRATPGGTARLAQIQQQNKALNTTIAQLNESLAAKQREIETLRTQLGTANKTAESLRHENETQRASSQIVPFPTELQNRDKQLDEARNEIQRINQLHADDAASLTAQQVRIAQLSDQLRVASATLDLERQLTAAGKDIRELLTARELHVIDVRDTDANGKPTKAFGRIFVTEGKTLTFYAFDLDQGRAINAKHRFAVWGSPQAKGTPAKSLGFFYVDDKTQNRWALKVSDPTLINEVSAVFVTVAPSAGTTAPTGPQLLYAYLGQPNHP